MALNPFAPVQAYVGYWNHSAEMQWKTRLPAALANFGLLPVEGALTTSGLRFFGPPIFARGCMKPAAAGAADRLTLARLTRR
jgi:hypothetical protein